IVEELGIPACNVAVGKGHVHQRKQARGVGEAEAFVLDHHLGDAVPADVRELVPELRVQALVLSARALSELSLLLHLLEITRIKRAVEGRWRGWPELIG